MGATEKQGLTNNRFSVRHNAAIDTGHVATSDAPMSGRRAGTPYSVRIAIPNYEQQLSEFYGDLTEGGVSGLCSRLRLPYPPRDFGLIMEHEDPAEVDLEESPGVLSPGYRELLSEFGIVIIRNARLRGADGPPRNRPAPAHLNFHYDVADRYTVCYRDPALSAHQQPRGASTLFIARIVGNLEALREGAALDTSQTEFSLFAWGLLDPLIGSVVLAHPWDAAPGCGEICLFDNRTVLHANYHKPARGYPIGSRFLS